MHRTGTAKISVVIPMYNEEQNVVIFCKRLFQSLDLLPEPWEVICVNDGSTDSTLELLRKEQEKRRGLIIVNLPRNFGQHAAVMAGFEQARGDWIVTLDADLQNPPEEIPRIVEQLRNGHDLVGSIRTTRKDYFFRRWASRITTWLVSRISGITLQDFGCMLRGYSKPVIKGILQNPEYRTFIPALATFFAKNPIEIRVSHEGRAAGNSKYSLLKLFGLQLDLMTGFSLWPLRTLFFAGIAISFLGLSLGALILVLRIYYGPEWAAGGVFTLFALLFFFVGAQFFGLGLIGEYIGRIFQAVRKRPPYVLGEVLKKE